MILLTNTIDICTFEERNGRNFICVNGYAIACTSKYDPIIMSREFDRWMKYNYPSFWRNPIRYLFGGRKIYKLL